MKQILIIFCITVLFASCGPSVKPLYTWGNYDDASFSYLKKNDEKGTQQLIETYKKIIEEQKGSRNTVPPGIYADYGFILIQSGKAQEGKALLEKEIALYPESKVFVERILKLME